jgi:hypothetical protein
MRREVSYLIPSALLGFIRSDASVANLSAIDATIIEEFQFAQKWLYERSIAYKEVHIDSYF